MDKQLYFCFGLPKSGTTFLQRMLNLHPEVSCPAEHNFNILLQNYIKLFQFYNDSIQVLDRRTGGQGVIPVDEETYISSFKTAVESIVYKSAGPKRIAGANDNSIMDRVGFFNDVFGSPRLIAIFRNPIDAAISAWHHNQRLAREENDQQHVEIMTRHGGIDGWVKFYAHLFLNAVQRYQDFSAEHDNIMSIRYEDLISHKRESLIRLFGFLGAATDEKIITAIIKNSSLEAMREASAKKEFFRSGSTDMGEGVVSDELRSEVARIAAPALQVLGYAALP